MEGCARAAGFRLGAGKLCDRLRQILRSAYVLAGAVVWKYFNKEKELVVNWKTASVGVLLVGVAKLIPIIGWIAAFLVLLIVFGTLTTMSYEYIKAQRA